MNNRIKTYFSSNKNHVKMKQRIKSNFIHSMIDG